MYSVRDVYRRHVFSKGDVYGGAVVVEVDAVAMD